MIRWPIFTITLKSCHSELAATRFYRQIKVLRLIFRCIKKLDPVFVGEAILWPIFTHTLVKKKQFLSFLDGDSCWPKYSQETLDESFWNLVLLYVKQFAKLTRTFSESSYLADIWYLWGPARLDLKNFKIAVEAWKFFPIIFVSHLENELRIKKKINFTRESHFLQFWHFGRMSPHPRSKLWRKSPRFLAFFLKSILYCRIVKISEIRKISKLSDFDLRIDKIFST